jgi:hypothetical protein
MEEFEEKYNFDFLSEREKWTLLKRETEQIYEEIEKSRPPNRPDRKTSGNLEGGFSAVS